jgi:mono/diheme cytochrome c family protein
MDLGSMAVPMGTSKGTSNAVIFGIALMAFRDKDLNLKPVTLRPMVIHHDMDAPAWWNVKKRERLYIDGFVEKNHRALIPFVMDQRNDGETMRGWEEKFKKVFAYINLLESPKYPYPVDHKLAAAGEKVFNDNCSSCHGTYGSKPTYPGRVVDLKKVGTDPIRLKALTKRDRKIYHESWFAHYAKDETVIDPEGYQAPPLDGIWASAPYFHNGSVPTVWQVLNPAERPVVWWREPDGYNQKEVGLKISALTEVPKSAKRRDQKREYFNTLKRGKSAQGHPFADRLSQEQKLQLVEYLKTL